MPQLGQVNAVHRLDVIPDVQLVTSAKKERESSGRTQPVLCVPDEPLVTAKIL